MRGVCESIACQPAQVSSCVHLRLVLLLFLSRGFQTTVEVTRIPATQSSSVLVAAGDRARLILLV